MSEDFRARRERARRRVEEWVRATMGWGPDRVTAHPAPHLSTGRFDLVVLAQRGMRSAGELYVMTDGERVLPAGAESLGRVLAEEGLPGDPQAVPAQLVAELFFRMAEVGGGRALRGPDDPELLTARPGSRERVSAPRAERDGDGTRVTFWSMRSPGGEPERWSVRVGPGGALEREPPG